MQISVTATKAEINTLLAAAKEAIPALAAVRSLELAEGNLRLAVDSLAGRLDVKLEFRLTDG